MTTLPLAIIQNDPEVPAGSYGERLDQLGIARRTVTPYTGMPLPAPAELAAVIVLGGAMGVHDDARHPFLTPLKEFMAACVAAHTPLLGICLGGQLLAHVLGGTVTSGVRGEKGTLPVTLTDAGREDPLFRGMDPVFTTFQWHHDSFTVPPGGVHLAGSAACPGQAFRCGASAWGLQFHPEVTPAIVAQWAGWTPETAPRTGELLAEFHRHGDAYRAASLTLLDNFLHAAGLR